MKLVLRTNPNEFLRTSIIPLQEVRSIHEGITSYSWEEFGIVSEENSTVMLLKQDLSRSVLSLRDYPQDASGQVYVFVCLEHNGDFPHQWIARLNVEASQDEVHDVLSLLHAAFTEMLSTQEHSRHRDAERIKYYTGFSHYVGDDITEESLDELWRYITEGEDNNMAQWMQDKPQQVVYRLLLRLTRAENRNSYV